MWRLSFDLKYLDTRRYEFVSARLHDIGSRYVFKMDEVRYFPSQDHDLLRQAVAKKVKDKEMLG